MYELDWNHVILPPKQIEILERVILENRKKNMSIIHNLKPKSKLLFCKIPEGGKTLTAKVLASVLNYPHRYMSILLLYSRLIWEKRQSTSKVYLIILINTMAGTI